MPSDASNHRKQCLRYIEDKIEVIALNKNYYKILKESKREILEITMLKEEEYNQICEQTD
jgi:hypothetical protein